MSSWIEVKKDSLSLSTEKDELHIYADDDYSGAIYVSLGLKELEEFLKDNNIKL